MVDAELEVSFQLCHNHRSQPIQTSAALLSKHHQVRRSWEPVSSRTMLTSEIGTLLKGATDDQGKLKDAALLIGIKLDLEAEIHLTARIKGDITIGLY
jgi:hypothetical protein